MDGAGHEAERFQNRFESTSWRHRLARWLHALPRRVRTYGPDVLGTVGVIGVMAWEWRNAALGFDQLFRPGIWWASIGGACICMLAMYLHRVAMEFGRAGKFYQTLMFGVLAFLTACVVWIGVWSNLAADSLNAGEHKIEERASRELLLSKIRTLERQYLSMPDPIGLEADKDALTSLEAQARQWGLKDLSSAPGTICDTQLDLTRRGFCVQAGDLREEIKIGQATADAKAKVKADLDDAKNQLINFTETSGAEHFEEMASMWGHPEDWKLISNLVVLAISVILFLAACFVNDYLAERRERKPVEQQ